MCVELSFTQCSGCWNTQLHPKSAEVHALAQNRLRIEVWGCIDYYRLRLPRPVTLPPSAFLTGTPSSHPDDALASIKDTPAFPNLTFSFCLH